MMVEVKIDSVRVSLMSQHRLVVLREGDSPRFLPIWIGPFEADAIIVKLQGVEITRPLTHDLLENTIEKLGAEIERVAITELRDDTFYAELILRVDGRRMAIDCRPSDAIALAVRARVPIYVADVIFEQAGISPEPDLEGTTAGETSGDAAQAEAPEAFRDFLAGLDLTGFK